MTRDARGVRLAAAVSALLVAGCTAKLVVTRVPPEALPPGERLAPDGVFYALPRTVVRVELPVERVETTAGRFAEYARLFFPHLAEEALARRARVKKANPPAGSAADSFVSFRLGTPALSAFGEPDPEQVYFVKVTGGLAVDRTAQLELTDQGSVMGAQAEVTHVGTEIALSTVSAVSGILARTLLTGAGAGVRAAEGAPPCPVRPDAALDDPVWEFFAGQSPSGDPVVQEAFALYCDLDPAEREPVSKAARRGDDDLRRAYRTFRRVYDLQGLRRSVLLGQSLTPEVSLREVDAGTARELVAFVGAEARESWTGSFEVRPAKLEDRLAILRFSERGGVCETADLRGKPAPPPRFTRKDACGDSRPVEVAFRLDGENQVVRRVAARYAVGEDLERSGDRAFRYRLPALARVDVAWAGDPPKPLGESGAAIAQFGHVVSLPASSGGRSLNYDLKFYEATGALKTFRLASKSAIQKGLADSLGDSTSALLDARIKKEREEAAESDELAQLERRRKLLEEQLKIRKACAELGLDCEEP